MKSFLIWGIVVAAAIFALGTWFTFGVYGKANTPAEFGDSFGFVNAVFSGFALLAVAYTLKQTQEELRDGQKQFAEQQKQLQQNTEALLAQKTELGRQVDVMMQQTFDTKFFQLMALLQSIVETLELPARPNHAPVRARGVFKKLYTDFCGGGNDIQHPQQNRDPNDVHPEERRQEISRRFRIFHHQYSNEMGHFFRTLYHIVLYVDRTTLSADEKYAYIRLVRAQLSQHQLLLLFYNGLTDDCGYPKCFRLIKRYRLLKNMDATDLIVPGDTRLYEILNPPLPAAEPAPL